MNDQYFDQREIVIRIASEPADGAALAQLRPLLCDDDIAREFWRHLSSAEWFPLLNAEGYFDTCPSAERTAEGGIRFPRWERGDYLARIAEVVPEEVVDVLGRIRTDNASVMRTLLNAACAIPVVSATRLVPAIVDSVEMGALVFNQPAASDLCVRLIEGKQADAASTLAEALFTPRIRDGEEGPGRRDEHWYKEGLQKVAPALSREKGAAFLPLLCEWLRAAVNAKKYVDSDTGTDYSEVWRPAIEEHEQNQDFDFAGVMVGITRTAFEEAIRADAISLTDALGMLQSQVFQVYHVFTRMRIHLINEFADQQPSLARQTMLDQSLLDHSRCKHEYAMLMGRRWNMLEPNEKAKWLSWIDDGPDMSDYDELMKRNFGREANNEDRQGRIRWWKYERLHWIREHLSDDRLAFYNHMRTKHGEPELADLNVRHGSGWGGEESPMTVDNLSAKTFEDAVDAVSAWQPEGSRFVGPSVEGLASTFKQYVASNRVAFSSQASKMICQPAIYVRSFISEMTEAAKAGEAIDLPCVLDLCRWVVYRPVDERTVPAQDDEMLVDKDWQWTCDEISQFGEAVCKARTDDGPSYSLDGIRETLWDIIDLLCRGRDKSYVVHDKTEDDPRVHDYLNLGINAPRGKAVKAAVEYARWVDDHTKVEKVGEGAGPGGFDAMPEVRDMLAWQIESGNRTYEVMSIIGSRIAVIYRIDREWLETNADALFDLRGIERMPVAAEGWAAWNAFLVWVRPHIEFYRRFKDQFAYAVEQAGTVDLADRSREQPMHHLGEHLMILYGRGQLDLDDDGGVLRQFIETANPEIRRHTIGFVGRSLRGDEDLPGDVLERFMSLWERYWEGPGQQDARDQPDAWLFGTWFDCGKFPNQWSLDRLEEFVEIAPSVEPDHSVVERLAEIADADVLKATRILDRMVRGDKEGWRVSGWTESAEAILERAMGAGGEVRREAESLINHLGRRGYTEFGKLLSTPR